MHGCCVRVTALLECFKWTLNKPRNRTGCMASTIDTRHTMDWKRNTFYNYGLNTVL